MRWPSAPGAPEGVITEVDGPRIRVKFDGDDEAKIFNARAGVLERVELRGMVRRVSTGSIGLLHAPTTAVPPRWQVILDGQILTVNEGDLRPHVLDDPHSRIVEGRLGSPMQFDLAVTARRYELEHLTNDLVSLGEARVDVKPHQVSVVHRVISDYPHRFLLCDEVGLGKTIEAGMVLKELRARGAAGRTLVIAPPNLVRQWQFELKSKFNESFSIINTDTVKVLRASQAEESNPFEVYDSVIVSSSWITMPKWSKLVVETPWDMVIVDEAHHARVRGRGRSRRETQLYKVVRALASPDAFSKRAALFLTATPMQLESGELYSLVELLDPALFPTEEHFDHHRAELPGLSRLVHELSVHGFPIPDEDADGVVAKVAGWLDLDADEAKARLAGGEDSVAVLCDDLSRRHLLSEVLIRNRKKVVGGFMPRQAHRWEVVQTEPERVALEAVEEYVREGYAQAMRTNDHAVGFVMVVFQKLMASSIRALRTSLDRRRAKLEASSSSPTLDKRTKKLVEELEGRLEDDLFVANVLEEVAAADADEATVLAELVRLLDAVPVDSKGEAFVERLGDLQRLEPNAKVLLFTEFRETQEYLRERLEPLGWNVQVFHGQLKPDAKDAAVDAFREATGPSILLSTEAGGEGRNFQFCHLLVNYDLPWNPMRIEQRIGRVDRIGQEHTVQVFNFWVKGTIEERVLDVLERRINVFEETVGGLDPILGDAERDLTKILQLGGDEREAALARYETQIEKKLKAARAAEEKLRDFIMETKSYSSEIAALVSGGVSPVTLADQERFTQRLLADANTYLQRRDDGTYEVTFHEPFVSDFPSHAKDGRKRLVAFRPDIKADDYGVEFMALGHPVVDDLLAVVTSPSYAGSAAAFSVPAGDDTTSTSGWLAVYELGVPGVREVRQLTPLFVSDDGAVDAETGDRLLWRAATFPKDRALEPADVPADALDGALQMAEVAALERLAELEVGAHDESRRQLERARAKLAGYFDYRQAAAQDRLASSRKTLADLERSDDAETRRILPVWKANVARDERLIEELADEREAQLAQLERRAEGGGDLRLVAVARIQAVSETPDR